MAERNPKAHAFILQTLKHWQSDPDLAGIRDADVLAKLPEAERAAFQKLWRSVAKTITKAGGAATPKPPAEPLEAPTPQHVNIGQTGGPIHRDFEQALEA